jgi:hypothetical protein
MGSVPASFVAIVVAVAVVIVLWTLFATADELLDLSRGHRQD